MFKSGIFKWMKNIIHERNASKFLVGKPGGKR
jgi:hypothetical protein